MSWLNRSKTKESGSSALRPQDVIVKASDRDAAEYLADAQRLEREKRRGMALRTLSEAVDKFPEDVDLQLARGSTLYGWSRFLEAYRAYGDALAAFPENVNLLARFGWCAHAVGEVASAEQCMRRVVDLRPNEPDAHYGLAVVLQTMKQTEKALESFRTVVSLNPKAAHGYTNIGICLMDLDRFAEAEIAIRKAIELTPDNPGEWLNLGINLFRQGVDGADDAFREAQRLEKVTGEQVNAFVSYASYLRNVGRASEALAMYNEYLPRCPNTKGLTQFGMCLLHTGDIANGWNLYEFRWLQEPLVTLRANIDTPTWQGQDLSGKTILVRAEQGVGDVVQFARYLSNFKELGATVVFQGRDGMEELSTRFVGPDMVVNSGEPFPEFHYFTNLMSLPRFFGNPVKSAASSVGYVRIDETKAAQFRALLDEKLLNIGLVWAGNPTHLQDKTRSILDFPFHELADLPNTRVYSLQKGDAAKRLAGGIVPSSITDWAPLLKDFGDTADAISTLDIIISVDTSVAHLAGALGKAVWILLPTPSEWRWMDERADSDWYPSARLIRQSTQGDWSNVIAEVKEAIRIAAREKVMGEESALDSTGDRSVVALTVKPVFQPLTVPAGLTAVGEMREGIFQYFQNRESEEGTSLRWYGEWHHNQLALLSRLVKLDQTVVEIGGGVGVHTVALSRFVGADGHVLVYENDDLVKQVLRENLRSNKARNVTVLNGRYRTSANADPLVETESVDDLELNGLDWLKVSASEASWAALEGCDATIWRSRPRMFLNVSQQHNQIVQSLAAKGYACWRHVSPVFRVQNFNNTDARTATDCLQIAILAIPEEVYVDVELTDCVQVI